ncbi:hypothetical protein GUJ93_ZPchr0013g36720 [Zizania palustris]|uniref:Uncharacterized protein n=1 Tax=Zizania palustris TaxID=103762 RepID=A0A8J5WYA7_ZIZPA|nr:hypothetical protein GUJ93_ZPchr0013g36720 [Zizania palustris]
MSASPPDRDGGEGRCVSPTASRRKGSPSRSGGRSRKSSGSREFGSSILNSVNKSTSQFKKSINRKSGSPIDWFPRKKTESYLKRKISIFRILNAARIQNKEAEEVLKGKLQATEAFEEARVIGVMMYDRPDCSNQQYEVESSSPTGGQSTHKITASFQTGLSPMNLVEIMLQRLKALHEDELASLAVLVATLA